MQPCPGRGGETPEEREGLWGDMAAWRGGGGGHGSLTFCIRESVSTMFFSTWSAFFCKRSMSSVSSLLEMLGRKMGGGGRERERETRHPTARSCCRGCPRGAVTRGVARGQPSLPGPAAASDSLLPF